MNYSSYLLASWMCIMLGYSQATITEDVNNLWDHFTKNVSSSISDDGPLFLNIMDRWAKDSDRKIITSQIVRVYFKIFEIFKNNSTIKKSLEKVKEDMIINFFPNNTASKMNDFNTVINIPVNDLTVQKKAILELKLFIKYLSSSTYQRQRKRRQNRNQ